MADLELQLALTAEFHQRLETAVVRSTTVSPVALVPRCIGMRESPVTRAQLVQ